MEIFKLIYLAAGPGIAFAIFIYYSDKWDPEPKRMALRAFFLGVLAWFPSYLFEGEFQAVFGLQGVISDASFSWGQKAFYAFFGVALAEELCKFLFFKAFICDSREFNEPYDGIVYGGLIGCGFATLENIMYIIPRGYEVGIMRMLTAVPGHVFDGVILGYFMGKAKFCPNPEKNMIGGLALVILLHGLYDSAAFLNVSWSIYPVFGMVALGIYLGLKAKKILERHSKYLASSSKEYFIIREGEKRGPYLLKDIRDCLSDGSVVLEDALVAREEGEEKSIREFLCSETGAEVRSLIKIPPAGQPVVHFLIFYGLTFGIYLYFWLHRNYREFKDYKNLDLNPELRVLGLYILTLIPYFIYGALLGELDLYRFSPPVEISFNLAMVGIETAFLFFLLRMIRNFVSVRLKPSPPLLTAIILFFALGALRKLLPWYMPYVWWMEVALIWLQGGALALIQKNINAFWQVEKKFFGVIA